jgi:sortase (surface protein transpeptidase)
VTRRPRHRRSIVLCVALTVLVAGCGSDAGGEREEGSPPASSTIPSAPDTAGEAPRSPGAPASTSTTTPGSTTTPAPIAVQGPPARIGIPAIDVDAAVIDLSKADDGTLEVPGWDDAGWWKRGPEPGERGPAVIVGHVDSKSGPAVFYDLERLVAGDEIVVTLDDGRTVTYLVDGTKRFAKDAFPTMDVYGLTEGPELRLITCDGEFDRSTGHYVDNLVVFATVADDLP